MNPLSAHPRVLVIDADPGIHRLLGLILEPDNCRVLGARVVDEGLAKANSNPLDLIVLDPSATGCAGTRAIRMLSESSHAPVMIVSASDQVDEIVAALDGGACDYVIKPFNGAELAARVRVQLRCKSNSGINLFIRGLPGCDPSAAEVFANGVRLALTQKETAVLRILASQPGSLVTSQHILTEIWGNDGPTQLNELRVYITRLRRKLEACGTPNLIKSERNVGYSLSLGNGCPSPAGAPAP